MCRGWSSCVPARREQHCHDWVSGLWLLPESVASPDGARSATFLGVLTTPATRADVLAILDDADPDLIDQVVETGASIDEIADAIHLVTDVQTRSEVPVSARVEQVRRILCQRVRNAGALR